jgi:two-component system nitrogen regulation response regulator GlnG/two-component system response regulator HydG
LSREQLLLRAVGTEAIEVDNVGQSRLCHDGVSMRTAKVAVNGTLQIGSQLLLLCVRRPAWTPAVRTDLQLHPFGAADEGGFVGESPAAWDLRRQIAFVAPLSGHVLITGASGTGKELAARAIHVRSPRARRPLVSRNAATLPESLVDAELFGNMKNYPNPGMPERPGLIGQAHGSSLFLDEIGDLPEVAQAHLLRVLDSGEYQRLGDASAIKADVRVLAATNRPDSLRIDFGPRLSLRVQLPDLNSRREDVPLIARCLVRRFAAAAPADAAPSLSDLLRSGPDFSPDLVRALVTHDYTTNVRELEGLLWQSVQESRGTRLECPRVLARALAFGPPAKPSATSDDRGQAKAVDPSSLEPSQIEACLAEHDGSIERAWRALGLGSRHVLVRLIKKHGLRSR